MSIKQYESIQHEDEIYVKLKEAELEAKNSDVRYSHSEIFDNIKKQLNEGKGI